MKYAANIITVIRILLSIVLVFFFAERTVFFALFVLSGLSDVLDGYIARKTNTKSAIGARLDSIADFFMFGVIAAALILWAGDRLILFLPFLIAIASIRLLNVVIAAIKYKAFGMLHTWANKAAGFLIFVSFGLFILLDDTALFWPVCAAALLSAIEETCIHLTSPTLLLNRRSIFLKNIPRQ